MGAQKIERVFIVGGGFSHYAGLPLTSDFTRAILAAREQQVIGKSGVLVDYLSDFIHQVFFHERSASAKFWPELEDVFTCLDLAANSGHNLGVHFSPSKLRTVRRALIVRMIRMLEGRHHTALLKKDNKWKILKRFLLQVDWTKSAFISMNWDTVVEHRLMARGERPNIEYGCDAVAAAFPETGSEICYPEIEPGLRARIIKIHGSINWLYCDNCRGLFWFPPGKSKIADQLISPEEWQAISPSSDFKIKTLKCGRCGDVSHSTRLATFSYRKALEFPMFQKSWFSAEKLLRAAKTWAFIGYSMPPADFEFKYLLKRIQLSRTEQPNFVLVTGGEQAEWTYSNYQRFFGTGIRIKENCFMDGLTEKAIACLLG